MTQLQQILLTSTVTIAGAVVIFGLTQFAQRFWFDPVQEYAKAVANIDFALLVFASTLGTPRAAPQEVRMEARHALRECSGRYLSAANSVRWWWLARLFSMVAKSEDVRLVVRNLIFNIVPERDYPVTLEFIVSPEGVRFPTRVMGIVPDVVSTSKIVRFESWTEKVATSPTPYPSGADEWPGPYLVPRYIGGTYQPELRIPMLERNWNIKFLPSGKTVSRFDQQTDHVLISAEDGADADFNDLIAKFERVGDQ